MNGKRLLLCLLISALLFSVAAAEIEVVDVSVSPESVYVLSLIHISEPTRPY